MNPPPSIPHARIADLLAARLQRRLTDQPEARIADLLSDTIYHERRRLDQPGDPEDGEAVYEALLDRATRAVRSGYRPDLLQAADALCRHYAVEIHNPFSRRAYAVATRALPGALTRLLSAASGRDLVLGSFDPSSRIQIHGPLPMLRDLVAQGATLVIAPTHVSNLDSPLIGYALYAAGLPPAAYGAGLNLFTNPVMSFFMRRLGAYTVDRRKRNALYKDTLKDYSTETIKRGGHSLFFPGGTRSRAGRIEPHLKKGLLGTGLQAWIENLQQRPAGNPARKDVYIVPCTLSIAVVLEAETLVADALAEEGKQRYIILDDESSRSREVASFSRRLMQLDCRVHVTFGQPLDPFGNPVDASGDSLDPRGEPVDRRGYVCDRGGAPVIDPVRDQLYTARLSEKLCAAYQDNLVLQSTHLAARAAWDVLRRRHPGADTFRLLRLYPWQRTVPRADLEQRIAQILGALPHLRRDCPAEAPAVLDDALRLFRSFHKTRALDIVPEGVQIGGALTWYYQNRLIGYPA